MKVLLLVPSGDEGALRVAQALGDVVALRAGPPEEEGLLRWALAAGAGRAVRLWDPALAGLDYLGLSTALAAAARTLGCQLVVAADRGDGAVGPAVADRLALPHLCGVLTAQRAAGDQLLVERRTTAGRQVLRGPAQAVLCVAALVPAAPRAAAGDAIDVLGLGDVGLSAVELEHRRLCVAPDAASELRPRPLCFPGAAELLQRLRQDGLLPRA